VFGYNVKNVAANRIPSSYEDLLSPYRKSQMGLDRESYDWLGGIMDIMGEQKGLHYARKLSEQDLKIIKGHTLLTQLVAAGEIRLLVDAYHHHIVSFKENGGSARSHRPGSFDCKRTQRALDLKEGPESICRGSPGGFPSFERRSTTLSRRQSFGCT
jgi:hypothetical protein